MDFIRFEPNIGSMVERLCGYFEANHLKFDCRQDSSDGEVVFSFHSDLTDEIAKSIAQELFMTDKSDIKDIDEVFSYTRDKVWVNFPHYTSFVKLYDKIRSYGVNITEVQLGTKYLDHFFPESIEFKLVFPAGKREFSYDELQEIRSVIPEGYAFSDKVFTWCKEKFATYTVTFEANNTM